MKNIYKTIAFRLVRRYRHTTVSKWLILAIDILLFVLSYLLMTAYQSGGFEHMASRYFVMEFLIALVLTLLFFFVSGSYRSIIRHTGMSDVLRILVATGGPLLVFYILNFVNNQTNPPIITKGYLLSYRATAMLYMLLAILMLTARLVMMRVYNSLFRRRGPSERVVIYGAGAAGILAQNVLTQDVAHEYHVVAFIDDDLKKVGQQLNGIPILRERDVLNPKFVKQKNIGQIIIAIPNLRVLHKQAISNRALDLGLTVKATPHVSQWLNGTFSSNQMQDLKIEDLLEREPVRVNEDGIVNEVKGRVVLVTGAAGLVGSELCRRLMHYHPARLVMLDQAESALYNLRLEMRETYRERRDCMEFVVADTRNRARLDSLFAHYRPELVFHVAAYKLVPLMESNPYEAVSVNACGTRNLADLAMAHEVRKFVLVSTDKAVSPTSVLGASQRMAEIYVQSRPTAPTRFVTARFGNVLVNERDEAETGAPSSVNSVIAQFKKQIAEGGPLTVTSKDVVRYFMSVAETCNLILETSAMGEGGEVFVFDMGKPVRIYNLARRMIQLTGHTDIEIVETGLRPGDKYCEETLSPYETSEPTSHPRIKHAKAQHRPTGEVDREFDDLQEALEAMDDMKLVGKMKQMVPEFRSGGNSPYHSLDPSTPPLLAYNNQ